jgi:3',5'-cyclic AMP phosphodiesterase CpdA
MLTRDPSAPCLQLRRRLAVAVLASCLLLACPVSGPAAEETGGVVYPIPDPGYSDTVPRFLPPGLEKIRSIVYPVLGCPALVAAGASLGAVVRCADGGTTRDWMMRISTHDPVVQSYTLPVIESSYDSALGCYLLTGAVPAHTPRDTFDCVVSSQTANISDIQHNAVRVLKGFSEDYRFVHLTDVHVGDPRLYVQQSPPENRGILPSVLVQKIIEEIEFLDPEFIVVSGDLVFGGPYSPEYAWAFELVRRFSLPLFMVPGNHDGYASGEGLLRDGLEDWKQVIGPPYYSFNYGGKQHFACLNTYDGPASRRDGWYVAVRQWGGFMGPDQLAWLAQDLQNAGREGRDSVIVAHHDPRGNIYGFGGETSPADEDGDGYAEAMRLFDMFSYQEWNDRISGRAVINLIAENNAYAAAHPGAGSITHVLLGHVHGDFIDGDDASGTWWVHTTAAGSAGFSRDDFRGYRVIGVEDGRVVSLNRTAPEGVSIPPGDNDDANNQAWDYQSYAGIGMAITTVEGNNDGSSAVVTQEVANYTEVAVSGVLKFYVPLPEGADGADSPYGYEVAGGSIRDIVRGGHDGDGNRLIVYVETGAATGERRRVTLRPVE